MITTYSFWDSYRQCPRKCYWRYFENLAPLVENDNLFFGTLIHDLLETWHGSRDQDAVIEQIDNSYRDRRIELRHWHLATAMMNAYMMRYPAETFKVVATEKVFAGPI